MSLTNTKIYSLILLLSCALAAQAQDASEIDEMEQFMDLLEQQTSLATKTRINADFVPGMVSVLSAEQLQRRGFRTVWEALASLPGVQPTMNETGMRSLTVRGVGTTFEPSKIKLLLNGAPLNVSANATTGTLYDTPIEQVERLEFIRGPGSAVYGEFAYAGVLNVITRKQGQQYSLGFESGDSVGFAALYSFNQPGDDFKSSLNLAANQSDGSTISSGDDRSPPGIPSYAPGPINNKRDFTSAILSFESGDFTSLVQLQQSNRGDHFGTNNLLPPDDKQTVISESMFNVDINQGFEVADDFTGNWSLSLLQSSTEQNSLFLGVAEAFGGLGNEDDIIADSLLEERRVEASVNLQYETARHMLFAELGLANIEVIESEQFINLDPNSNLPSPSLNEFPAVVDRGEERRALSLVLQDEFYFDERTTLTTGLRFDDYEDIGSNLSPRIAVVWRQSQQQVYKFQLARAFKPPSLIEFNGAVETEIEAETTDTLEMGHIYLGGNLVLRNTIYLSRLDDLILFQDFAPFGYLNTGPFDLRGYELEVESSINNQWQINASLSLQDYADDELPGAAPWMIKLGAEYRLRPLTAIHLQLSSIGNREREASDSRNRFDQVTQLDLSLRKQNVFEVSGLDLRLGITNLLDEELHHPATVDTYADDYPYSDGSLFWLRLVYQP